MTVSQVWCLCHCEKGFTSKLSGVNRINGLFETWIKKNSVIGGELSKIFSYQRIFKTLDKGLGTFSLGIYAYDGEDDNDWAWDESDNLLPNFRRVCTLAADLSGLRSFLKVQKHSEGQEFWVVDFEVKVLFGGTALKARMTWYEGVSISHLYPQVTDNWLYPSGNPARRPCQHYTKLCLLDYVYFPSQEDGGLDSMNNIRSALASPLDTQSTL